MQLLDQWLFVKHLKILCFSLGRKSLGSLNALTMLATSWIGRLLAQVRLERHFGLSDWDFGDNSSRFRLHFLLLRRVCHCDSGSRLRLFSCLLHWLNLLRLRLYGLRLLSNSNRLGFLRFFGVYNGLLNPVF